MYLEFFFDKLFKMTSYFMHANCMHSWAAIIAIVVAGPRVPHSASTPSAPTSSAYKGAMAEDLFEVPRAKAGQPAGSGFQSGQPGGTSSQSGQPGGAKASAAPSGDLPQKAPPAKAQESSQAKPITPRGSVSQEYDPWNPKTANTVGSWAPSATATTSPRTTAVPPVKPPPAKAGAPPNPMHQDQTGQPVGPHTMPTSVPWTSIPKAEKAAERPSPAGPPTSLGGQFGHDIGKA